MTRSLIDRERAKPPLPSHPQAEIPYRPARIFASRKHPTSQGCISVSPLTPAFWQRAIAIDKILRLSRTGVDVVYGAGDGDLINGGDDADQLSGNENNDVIYGDDPSGAAQSGDAIDGGDGADQLSGFGGNDVIFGGAGGDYINGGSGTDTIRGQTGDDTLAGGANSDTF